MNYDLMIYKNLEYYSFYTHQMLLMRDRTDPRSGIKIAFDKCRSIISSAVRASNVYFNH